MRVRSGKRVAVLAMVCAAAVATLLVLQAGRIREEWYLKRLSSEDAARRDEAARRLAELGVARAIPRLVDLLRGQTGLSMRSREPASIVRALEDLAAPRAVPFLEETARDRDLEVRSWARARLSRTPGGLDALVRLAAAPDPALRVEAICELRRLGPDAAAALRPLEAALRDPDAGVRLAAAGALGQLGPAAAPAVPSLVAALGDEDPGVLRQAVAALRKVGTTAVVGPLVEAFERDPASRPVVVMALLDHCAPGPDGPARGEALRRLLAGYKPKVVDAAVEIEETLRRRREEDERARREKQEEERRRREGD